MRFILFFEVRELMNGSVTVRLLTDAVSTAVKWRSGIACLQERSTSPAAYLECKILHRELLNFRESIFRMYARFLSPYPFSITRVRRRTARGCWMRIAQLHLDMTIIAKGKSPGAYADQIASYSIRTPGDPYRERVIGRVTDGTRFLSFARILPPPPPPRRKDSRFSRSVKFVSRSRDPDRFLVFVRVSRSACMGIRGFFCRVSNIQEFYVHE